MSTPSADDFVHWTERGQTPETEGGLWNRLNMIIVQLNFPPPKNNALTVILNVFLILTDETIFILYYFYAHVWRKQPTTQQ